MQFHTLNLNEMTKYWLSESIYIFLSTFVHFIFCCCFLFALNLTLLYIPLINITPKGLYLTNTLYETYFLNALISNKIEHCFALWVLLKLDIDALY
jgi:hypothetical protein